MRASIVYWTGGDAVRLDGGGQRVLGWRRALESLGYDVEVVGMRVFGAAGGAQSAASRAKRAVFPMPFEQPLPDVGSAQLVVATVPAVFRDAARRIPRERLVFDWMDRWSANAQTMTSSSPVSAPGAALQSAAWRRRERLLPRLARGNAYAGFADFASMRSDHGVHAWLPNPVEWLGRPSSPPDRPRRVGFIGSLDYPPNEISLRAFFDRFGTRLDAAGIEVVVAGFGSERVRSWPVAATVLGEVGHPRELYDQVDAAIVPVEHGGGIKIKAIEGLAAGLPVYATEHVRDGFGPEFRDVILDVETLFSVRTAPHALSRESFDATFGQDAFTVVVDRIVHG